MLAPSLRASGLLKYVARYCIADDRREIEQEADKNVKKNKFHATLFDQWKSLRSLSHKQMSNKHGNQRSSKVKCTYGLFKFLHASKPGFAIEIHKMSTNISWTVFHHSVLHKDAVHVLLPTLWRSPKCNQFVKKEVHLLKYW